MFTFFNLINLIFRLFFSINFILLLNFFQDETGSYAESPQNPVIKALPVLKKWFPNLVVACDVCLCPYTTHGHCGILNKDGTLNNNASIKRIAEIALSYAKNGEQTRLVFYKSISYESFASLCE